MAKMRFKKIIIFIISLVALLATGASIFTMNKFKTLDRMQDVKSTIESITSKTKPEDVLIIFDVDMVLTQPTNPAARYAAIFKYLSTYRKMAASISNEAKNLAATYLTQFTPQELVEKEIPEIIAELQKQGFKTIALTASLTGKFSDSKNKFIFQKRDLLKSISIDFEKSNLPFGIVIPLMNFPKYLEGYPTYYHGVLCSNGEKGPTNKGSVLSAFLNQHAYKGNHNVNYGQFFKLIIMIDDKTSNLEDVKASLKKDFPEIQFIGIEYNGAKLEKETKVTEQEFEEFWQKIIQDSKSITH